MAFPRLKTLLTAMAVSVASAASAQYTITLNDATQIKVACGSLSFKKSGTVLQVGDTRYDMSDVASIEPLTEKLPVVLAYHPYYSTRYPKAEMVTHINYGFAEVYVKDNIYKGFKLQGNESSFERIAKMKEKNPSLKILLSFTHTVVNSDNKQDGGFSCIAANAEYRLKFAEDCVAFLEKWGIDGIDIDWEFPGLSWSGSAADPINDVKNYTLLMKQLRETLGNNYLLTFAGYCMDVKTSSSGSKYIDVAAVEPYVDFVNIMTYDMDEAPHFQNAIKSSASYWDIERTIKSYKKANFPMEKITLGIPFYVRNSFSNGAIAYNKFGSEFLESKGFITENWDNAAQVPYVTLNGKNYGSYDNPRSIEIKAKYAADLGLLGLFYWCTYEDNNKHTLSKAVWDSTVSNYEIKE